MSRVKRKWGLICVLLVLTLPLIVFGTLFLLSAKIPDRWQEITGTMDRTDVAAFLESDSAETSTDSDGRDVRRIKRPIGDWLLLISYNDDDSFRHAHLRYSSPVFGEHTRARNYSESDDPYPIRAQK